MPHSPVPSEADGPVTIARADSAVGEVALRRRGEVVELIVDGAVVMDTDDVTTEVDLDTLSLSLHPGPGRVLVGGLGLGFTASAVLADPRVTQVVVAEIAAPLLDWAREGLLPANGLSDPRLTLRTADVGDLLSQTARTWDLVLLDVDNGPDFLVRRENAGLYAAAGLRASIDALRPGGVLAIWSSHRAPALLEALVCLGEGPVQEVVRQVHREGRELEYAIYLVTRGRGGRADLAALPAGE